jgi:CheY-like chemotaxis protein
VIAITGFGRPDDVERIRAAGFYSHLTKPLNLAALAGVLEQLANGDGKQGLSGTGELQQSSLIAAPGNLIELQRSSLIAAPGI